MADNELALVGGEISASTVSEALTKRLEDVLLLSTDAKAAARTVVATPELLAEARDKLSLVSRLAAPIDRDSLYAAIQPLLIMFGPPNFGQDDVAEELQQAWFDIVLAALKDHPRESIDIAVSEWMRIGKPFFPKPSELNALAQEATDEIRLIAFRLRLAVTRADLHRPPPKRTEEETQEIKAMTAELRGPDGRIHLGAKSVQSVTPKTDRQATAEALRKMSDYR